MTIEEIIQGLQFTLDMFLSDPLTGEALEKPRNNMDKTTIDACKGAIELLQQQPCEDAISRAEALKALDYDIKSFEFKSGVGRYMNEIANLLNTIYEIQSDNIKALPPVQPYNTSEWCKTCKEYDQDKHCCPRYNKVIRNTVEEMKQPCEDAISRADAINKVTNFYTNCERLKMFRHTSNEVKQTVTDILCDLPPVQPKLKTGHWITKSHVYGVTYCSECDFELKIDNTNYCPNCGAEMMNVPDPNDGKLSEIPTGSESEDAE